ncbi:MAG TPA: FtsX-like permease family protein [Candidatus Methylomirabilis sp.]|nr:FtsX-like permease family protein [Candidatus Methylomirabilis sp.]
MELPLFPLHAAAIAVGSFALLATVLAAIGIYGVMAYSVEQRRQEIGIRMALGASATDVWRLALRQGVILTTIGMLLGLTPISHSWAEEDEVCSNWELRESFAGAVVLLIRFSLGRQFFLTPRLFRRTPYHRLT